MKQRLAEIVNADERLMLCWQRLGMRTDKYTREFKARVQTCEELNSTIGNSVELQKTLCADKGV